MSKPDAICINIYTPSESKSRSESKESSPKDSSQPASNFSDNTLDSNSHNKLSIVTDFDESLDASKTHDRKQSFLSDKTLNSELSDGAFDLATSIFARNKVLLPQTTFECFSSSSVGDTSHHGWSCHSQHSMSSEEIVTPKHDEKKSKPSKLRKFMRLFKKN